MKKLLKAFTLAEVLVTLGIIGVVARLTLPALMENVQTQSTATALSKAVNTLEMGNKRILQETGSRSLTGAGLMAGRQQVANANGELNPDNYFSLMNSYMNGSYRGHLTLTINGTQQANQNAFITKDGILFASATSIAGLSEPLNKPGANVAPGALAIPRTIPPKYHGDFAKILVDINGTAGPNQLAKDQFVFYIDNYGSAIAYGGAEYQRYALNNGAFVAGGLPVADRTIWESQCAAGMTPSTNSAKASCTGSIVDNNFKVVYTY